jgi:hypothetical protein
VRARGGAEAGRAFGAPKPQQAPAPAPPQGLSPCRTRSSSRPPLPSRPPADAAARTGAFELLDAITAAERAHSGRAEEAPLGQWEVEALAPRADVLPPQLALTAPSVSARRLSVEAMAAMGQALAAGGASLLGAAAEGAAGCVLLVARARPAHAR